MEGEQGFLSVDVGGGWGELAAEKARQHPDRKYVVLEPHPPKVRRAPGNFSFLSWQSGTNKEVPLLHSSVDELEINYLYAEIRYLEEDDGTMAREHANERYQKMVEELRPILKPNAKVIIRDANMFIRTIVDIFQEKGFVVKHGPAEVSKNEETQWSKVHSRISLSNNPSAENLAKPMEIVFLKK